MPDLHEAAEHLRHSDIWLHKPTNKRYQLAYSVAGLNELHPVNGQSRYASDEHLKNTEIWSRV